MAGRDVGTRPVRNEAVQQLSAEIIQRIGSSVVGGARRPDAWDSDDVVPKPDYPVEVRGFEGFRPAVLHGQIPGGIDRGEPVDV